MSKIEDDYTYRYVAQILLEATSPLKVASGESNTEIDSPVLKNWNGLPMIQGSSMAGVLRASFDEDEQDYLFGKDMGSRVFVSHMHLTDDEGNIPYGLGRGTSDAKFLKHYDDLPSREHTAINHHGVALKGSKFDEEVVYAGSRFKFELEFLATKDSTADEMHWHAILSKLSSPLFRLGGGSTKGFGEMKVISCLESTYIIGKDYHEKPSDLNISKGSEKEYREKNKVTTYSMALKPDDFFSFGSGFGDDEVDDIAIMEETVEWNTSKGKFTKQQILFPASSLKGALSHRVAFHYNRLDGKFADEVKDIEDYTGANNVAVSTLFGAEKGHKNEAKGKALFSDMFKPFNTNEVKIFDHVKIDRFTGGAMNSALYNEKVIAQKDVWKIKIVLADDINNKVKEAFEATLDDLAKGWLPLGGKVNRGHGVFVSPDYVEGETEKRGWSCTKGDTL